jgi:hypothetical protein
VTTVKVLELELMFFGFKVTVKSIFILQLSYS